MKKTLVVYFSASGVTARAAKEVAAAVGADLYEIRPEQPYTASDLDWMDKRSRSTLEMNDPACRPAIAEPVEQMEQYDTVFVGSRRGSTYHHTGQGGEKPAGALSRCRMEEGPAAEWLRSGRVGCARSEGLSSVWRFWDLSCLIKRRNRYAEGFRRIDERKKGRNHQCLCFSV